MNASSRSQYIRWHRRWPGRLLVSLLPTLSEASFEARDPERDGNEK